MQFIELTGDVTEFKREPGTFHFIPHVVNSEGIIGSGVAMGLKRKFPEVGIQYSNWFNGLPARGFCKCLGDSNKSWQLGNMQVVGIGDCSWCCNMLAQKGLGPAWNMSAGRYEAIEECLYKLRAVCLEVLRQEKKICIDSPKFGSLRSGLSWDVIFERVQDIFADIDGTWRTYSYEEMS